jgi:cytoskeletal protein RodZ
MKHKDFEINGASRSNQRAKRRKTNIILNSLIAIVILLIIIVSFSIFFSNGDHEATSGTASNESTQKSDDESIEESQNIEKDEVVEDSSSDEETDSESSNSETDADSEESDSEELGSEEMTPTEPESEDVVSEGGSDPNVKKTITNPDWQPVGTSQTGEHATVYDSNSTDWKEMEKAISYATGIDSSNMTIWFLGRNNESGSQSVSTVSSKDNSITFRVVIEWIDGQGWKPIQVEELIENDRR